MKTKNKETKMICEEIHESNSLYLYNHGTYLYFHNFKCYDTIQLGEDNRTKKEIKEELKKKELKDLEYAMKIVKPLACTIWLSIALRMTRRWRAGLCRCRILKLRKFWEAMPSPPAVSS